MEVVMSPDGYDTEYVHGNCITNGLPGRTYNPGSEQ